MQYSKVSLIWIMTIIIGAISHALYLSSSGSVLFENVSGIHTYKWSYFLSYFYLWSNALRELE